MTIPERGAAEAAQRIADALEHAGIPYAIGGALALAIAGVPRGTADVDINVFVELGEAPKVIAVLASLGIVLDETVERMVLERRSGLRVQAPLLPRRTSG